MTNKVAPNSINLKSKNIDSSDREKSKNLSYLTGLYKFFIPYKKWLFAATTVLILTAILSLLLPLAVRGIVDSFANDSVRLTNKYFLIAVVMAGFLALGTAGRYYLVTRLGERIVGDIRVAVFSRVINMSPEFFERILTGEILSRLTTDTTLILSVVSSSVSFAMRNVLILVGGLGFMTYTSAKLTGLAFLIVPLILLPVLILGNKLRKLSRTSQDKIADTSGVAAELLVAAQTVQANTNELFSINKFFHMTEESFLVAKKRIFVRSILTAMLIFFVFTGIVVVVWFGALSVKNGLMTEGQLVQFLIYSVLVAGSIAALSETFGELQRAAGASERLLEILAIEDNVPESKNPHNLSLPIHGGVSFKDISFSYPARPQVKVIKNLNLEISSGETVALVGPSGSGKTTLFQLLLRFYDPSNGSISFDNCDISTLFKKSLRENISLVPQDPIIFAMTAMDNIRFSRPTATDDEVKAAAIAADAHNFISELPLGYDTFVGERGIMLSGGQRQRVAIARAVLRDAPILLLDEATSSLDSVSEKAVQTAVESLSLNRTTIVIAHRLSTVKKADRIIVLDSGSIVESGSHTKLIGQGGLYSTLAQIQLSDQ
ncbi:MAG: ABC transporter transmembrane domain-containing protein [Paracoccaceae bacterium]|nr:ABC transporter transmembrane domain-containing protein [Paracoccaceae bacterium]